MKPKTDSVNGYWEKEVYVPQELSLRVTKHPLSPNPFPSILFGFIGEGYSKGVDNWKGVKKYVTPSRY